MIKLYTDDGALELFPDEGVILKEKLLDDTGLQGGIASFTKDFTIPASSNNNKLLSHYENKHIDNPINPNTAISARIEVNGEFDILGKIEIISVTYKYGIADTYNIVFYSKVTNLKTIIGDTLLADVDAFDTKFGFTWSTTSITDTWSPYDSIYIPIISWNRWLKWYSSSTGTDDIATPATGVLMTELRVGLNFIDFIEAIGTEFGITIEFNKVTGSLFSLLYIIPSLVTDVNESYSIEQYKTDVQTASAITITTTRSIVVMTDEISDPHNNWSSPLYSPEFDGVYNLRFTLTNSTAEKRELFVVENSLNIDIDSVIIGGTSSDVYLNVTLNSANSYRFEIQSIVGSGTHTAYLRFRTNTVPFNLIGQDFSAQAQMPDMKVIDFMSEFLKAFNLMIYESDTDVYTIIDIANLYSSTVLDISQYVDNKSLTYKKTNVYNEISYKHKTSEDVVNKAFLEVTGREYGQLIYRPDIDFSDGKKEIESIFNIFPPAYMDVYDSTGKIGTTDMRHHFQLSDDTPVKPILSKFMLLYHNGEKDTDYTWYLQTNVDASGNPTFASQSTYPAYSAVREYQSDSDTYTVSYAEEQVFVGDVAGGTVVNTFSLDWLTQKYDAGAYELELEFPVSYSLYLQITDYVKIAFNDIEHIIDEYSYDSAKGMIKLKLLRYDN